MEPVTDSERELTQHKTMKMKSRSRQRAKKTQHTQQLNVELGNCSFVFLDHDSKYKHNIAD